MMGWVVPSKSNILMVGKAVGSGVSQLNHTDGTEAISSRGIKPPVIITVACVRIGGRTRPQ